MLRLFFSSNRIPDGWSRRPLFCPGNLLRLPNRKVTHGLRACGAGGAGGEGTARRLRTAQAFGCPVAAIEALDQFLPSRRQLLSLVQRVLPPGRNPAPFPLTPRWRGGQGCVTKLSKCSLEGDRVLWEGRSEMQAFQTNPLLSLLRFNQSQKNVFTTTSAVIEDIEDLIGDRLITCPLP